jgi:hypothetical protein
MSTVEKWDYEADQVTLTNSASLQALMAIMQAREQGKIKKKNIQKINDKIDAQV